MGLATALRRETPLKLDTSAYRESWRTKLLPILPRSLSRRRRHHRTYALDQWNVDARVASLSEVQALRIFDHIVCAARPDIPYFARPVVRQQHHGFDPSVLRVPRNCLLVGFWQSEKFFIGIESRLRRELTPRFPLSPRAEAMANTIKSEGQSVFLHVRRGDYLANESFEVCSLAYYQKAISYLKRHVQHPRFFVFSDDPEWAGSHLAVDDCFTLATTLELSSDDSMGREYEDLWLMGLCRHGIVSNSSFSWWGAWLNAAKERIVVAPSVWLPKPICDSRVFVPEYWARIDP
jgi:hypothetical protein